MHLTPGDMEGLARASAANPAVARLNELIVEEAERVGGLGLQAMRLSMGHIFGEPWMMTIDEVADRLGLSEEAVSDAIEQIHRAARGRWITTAEFRRWRSPENFSYVNFTESARNVVDSAARLAGEVGADATTSVHLRTALDAPASSDRRTGGGRQSCFAAELCTVLRRAHAAAVATGNDVELRHLRDALEADTS